MSGFYEVTGRPVVVRIFACPHTEGATLYPMRPELRTCNASSSGLLCNSSTLIER